MSTWREKARPVIRRVIVEVGTSDMKALRKALSDAYPFWEKGNYPYKVWLDEIKQQLAPPKPSRQAVNAHKLEQHGQERLFA